MFEVIKPFPFYSIRNCLLERQMLTMTYFLTHRFFFQHSRSTSRTPVMRMCNVIWLSMSFPECVTFCRSGTILLRQSRLNALWNWHYSLNIQCLWFCNNYSPQDARTDMILSMIIIVQITSKTLSSLWPFSAYKHCKLGPDAVDDRQFSLREWAEVSQWKQYPQPKTVQNWVFII